MQPWPGEEVSGVCLFKNCSRWVSCAVKMDIPALESWPSRKPKRPGAMMDGLQPEISFHRWVAHSGRLNRRLRVCSSGRKALQRDWALTWLVLGEGRQDSMYQREAPEESVMPGQKFPPKAKLWWIWDPSNKRPASLGPREDSARGWDWKCEAEQHRSQSKPVISSLGSGGVMGTCGHWCHLRHKTPVKPQIPGLDGFQSFGLEPRK